MKIIYTDVVISLHLSRHTKRLFLRRFTLEWNSIPEFPCEQKRQCVYSENVHKESFSAHCDIPICEVYLSGTEKNVPISKMSMQREVNMRVLYVCPSFENGLEKGQRTHPTSQINRKRKSESNLVFQSRK